MTGERASFPAPPSYYVALRRELGLLTEEEIAAIADVEVKTVRDWRVKRTGPPWTTLSRRPLYRVEAFQKWLKAREEDTQP